MIINQKRILGISKLKGFEEGKNVRIVVRKPEKGILKKMGFGDEVLIGHCVLPRTIGPASRRNANGTFIIHREREKEICYRMHEWTYMQFCGRDERVEVTESVVIPYERYPRTLIPPKSIELVIDKDEEEMVLTSPDFIYGKDNEKIVVAVNVFLEYFGFCEVLTVGMDSGVKGEMMKLNWKILPRGKCPWETQRQRIEPFLLHAKGSNRKVIEKRLETINKHEPDFTAIGDGGFSGYIVHGFHDSNLFVLESVQVNNATYILSEDWESISKLTKAEILSNDLHEHRVIHSRGWYEKIDEILK